MHRIEAHIMGNWGHLKNVPLFVACSGGLDSMVLLNIFYALDFDVRVLHVNYQLRGEASDGDQAFVAAFCLQHSIPFEVLMATVDPTKNLQESARQIRYDWFESKMDEVYNSKTLLAHHTDDQVETFFLNLARKSGILGMSCMLAEHQNYIRPLLGFSKVELAEYAQENNLQWREDASNASTKYRRNFLRNEVLPTLYASHPELKKSILTLITAFQSTQTALEKAVAPLVNEIQSTQQLSFDSYEQLTNEQQFALFSQFDITGKELNEIERLRHSERGKKLVLRHQKYAAIVADDGYFSFLERIPKQWKLCVDEVSALPKSYSKSILYLDHEAIHGSLMLRSPIIGDRISPIGMKGSQLISDILKDAKISANEKQDALVLCDDDTIHWLVGYKVGRLALAHSGSKRILKCTISEVTQQ